MLDTLNITHIEDALRRVLDAHTGSPWLDNDAAAAYIGCEPGTLKAWRARGEGPRYYSVSHRLVRYNKADLDAFLRGEDGR
jgi:hypothetical protein